MLRITTTLGLSALFAPVFLACTIDEFKELRAEPKVVWPQAGDLLPADQKIYCVAPESASTMEVMIDGRSISVVHNPEVGKLTGFDVPRLTDGTHTVNCRLRTDFQLLSGKSVEFAYSERTLNEWAVSGKVTDAFSGEPAGNEPVTVTDPQSGVSAIGVTDANGVFTVFMPKSASAESLVLVTGGENFAAGRRTISAGHVNGAEFRLSPIARVQMLDDAVIEDPSGSARVFLPYASLTTVDGAEPVWPVEVSLAFINPQVSLDSMPGSNMTATDPDSGALALLRSFGAIQLNAVDAAGNIVTTRPDLETAGTGAPVLTFTNAAGLPSSLPADAQLWSIPTTGPSDAPWVTDRPMIQRVSRRAQLGSLLDRAMLREMLSWLVETQYNRISVLGDNFAGSGSIEVRFVDGTSDMQMLNLLLPFMRQEAASQLACDDAYAGLDTTWPGLSHRRALESNVEARIGTSGRWTKLEDKLVASPGYPTGGWSWPSFADQTRRAGELACSGVLPEWYAEVSAEPTPETEPPTPPAGSPPFSFYDDSAYSFTMSGMYSCNIDSPTEVCPTRMKISRGDSVGGFGASSDDPSSGMYAWGYGGLVIPPNSFRVVYANLPANSAVNLSLSDSTGVQYETTVHTPPGQLITFGWSGSTAFPYERVDGAPVEFLQLRIELPDSVD